MGLDYLSVAVLPERRFEWVLLASLSILIFVEYHMSTQLSCVMIYDSESPVFVVLVSVIVDLTICVGLDVSLCWCFCFCCS